jgi:membrane-bound lytic murein transglycosylase MltF
MLFVFASYNAGPNRVAKLRKEATSMGLDPNVWFDNVELVAAKEIGQETVTYVANIYKYYVAYKLARGAAGPPAEGYRIAADLRAVTCSPLPCR